MLEGYAFVHGALQNVVVRVALVDILAVLSVVEAVAAQMMELGEESPKLKAQTGADAKRLHHQMLRWLCGQTRGGLADFR